MAINGELEDRLSELRSSLRAIPEVAEPPKPTFRILGVQRSELTWNTFLAYFLDPSQPHGFDADLLKSLLEVVEQETAVEINYLHRDIETVEVDTEVTSPQNSRLDIVIRAPEEWFVCIESKVDAPEGDRQTQRYIEDDHIGAEEKSEYPEDNQHYIFLSKETAPDATADCFKDVNWSHVVEAFTEVLRRSQGRYPRRSASQLEDFLSTISEVTHMDDDEYTETQLEKVQLLAEYKEDIDELVAATNQLRQRALEEWPERFRSHVSDEAWTDEWHARSGKWGTIYRDSWYLDSDLNPTDDVAATRGNDGVRLHFMHYLRDEDSFLEGELQFELVCNTRVPVRDEFYELYTSDRWQAKVEPKLAEHNIMNRGNKSEYTHKTYDVAQSALPESYFETLATAFEEHRPLAEVANEILNEAVDNVVER